MTAFLKAVIDKFKIKEIIAIIFIAALIVTLIPKDVATKLNILEFRNDYQTYISLCLIVTGAFYILSIFNLIKNFIIGKFFNWERTAINYMKKYMSQDEMGLLIEKFYDRENDSFRVSGYIDYSDGRKAALEMRNIIYRASEMGKRYIFAYNLQPVVRDFLNRNLQQGNIKMSSERFEYILK